MAKPKLILNPSPTFKAKVAIPVHGGAPVDVEFTFKHRSREAYRDFLEALPNREDVDVVLDVAAGWDLDDPFDADSVAKMTENYIGSARAVLNTYMVELTGGRAKN